jgi:hypothetical protein
MTALRKNGAKQREKQNTKNLAKKPKTGQKAKNFARASPCLAHGRTAQEITAVQGTTLTREQETAKKIYKKCNMTKGDKKKGDAKQSQTKVQNRFENKDKCRGSSTCTTKVAGSTMPLGFDTSLLA